MDKYYINEDAFENIFLYLKDRQDIYCKNKDKTRKFLEGVYFIMKTGAQWGELPKSYGKHKSVHSAFYLGPKRIYGMRYCLSLRKVAMSNPL
jgi:transposase